MLWFLAIAASRKYVVESYVDEAKGVMAENAAGKLAMTRVTLRPEVVFSAATIPTQDALAKMHHLAHENCFIANSVKTEVVVEPV
jgi:organic hydroperoxide reductase OsmC/OhrA